VSLGVAFVAMRLQVRGDLGLQGHHKHPAGALASDLVEQGSPVGLVLHRLVADDVQHGCRLFLPARPGAAVAQAGRYAAGVTGSAIHNIRAYLVRVGMGGLSGARCGTRRAFGDDAATGLPSSETRVDYWHVPSSQQPAVGARSGLKAATADRTANTRGPLGAGPG